MSDTPTWQAHHPTSDDSVIKEYLSQEPVVRIMHGTSFDNLDLQDIVDPFLLSPRLPYPPASHESSSKPEISLSHCRPVNRPLMPVLHVRSRSLGSVVTASPISPPRSKLPPIPSLCEGASQDSPDAGTVTASDSSFPRSGIVSEQGTLSSLSDFALAPTSILSSGDSMTESQGSVTSEDDISQRYHTAPASPAGAANQPDLTKTPTKALAYRPSRHARQSSSTSTIRLLFKRGFQPDSDNSSDSETDSDAVATPTDPTANPLKHKRGSSFFKVLGRLKSGM